MVKFLLLCSLFGQEDTLKPQLVVLEDKIQAFVKKEKIKIHLWFHKPGDPKIKGNLTLKILDTNDDIISTTHKEINIDKEEKEIIISLAYTSPDPLIWQRLKYKFISEKCRVEGIVAFSEILAQLETYVIAQDEFIANSIAGIRVITLNHTTQEPIAGANVKVLLDDRKLLLGQTNEDGTLDAKFKVPSNVEKGNLKVFVASSIGSDTISQKVRIREGTSIYLVTDKPIYQPSQTIHFRALALERPKLTAVQNKPILIEIKDPKGNKVFKYETKTNKFGVIGGKFRLAPEVNLGEYEISAKLGKVTQQKTVTVKRYVLPKFKIDFKTDKDFYMPGEKVKANLACEYFFGKPTRGAKVKIIAKKFDVKFEKFEEITGQTDKRGKFGFSLTLPRHFIGLPLEKGDARVWFEIQVTDPAQHTERITEEIKIVKAPIKITILPESGELVPGVKNKIFVSTTYPDGKPAPARIVIKTQDATFTRDTDKMGLATFILTPRKEESVKVEVTATDKRGRRASLTKELKSQEGSILVRTDKTLYKVGENLVLTVLTSHKKGKVYVDIIKNKQTILTQSLEIKDNRATKEIALTSDLVGSIWVSAYMITRQGDIIRDAKAIYINPANDLDINVTLDKEVYLPREEANLKFVVKNKKGLPRVAAIGVAIVDEAVFALTELRPGLEKVYFTLEEELATPRWEIHGLTPELIVGIQPPPIEAPQVKDRMAQLAFIDCPIPEYKICVNSYLEKRKGITDKFRPLIEKDAKRIHSAVKKYYNLYKMWIKEVEYLLNLNLITEHDLQDPWGERYEIKIPRDLRHFTLISYGPDKIKDTKDDIELSMPPYEIRPAGRVIPRFLAGEGVVFKEMVAPVSYKATVSHRNGGKKEPMVRKYFPETLFFEPCIITNMLGRAEIKVPLADAITKWRLTLMASSTQGELGNKTSNIKVFQDFFIDIDLPVVLTEGDEISIPVAIYNYLPSQQTVKLRIEENGWFELLDDKEKEKTIGKNEVSVVYFRIKAKKIGWHKLLVKAYGEKMSDAVERKVEVIPDGKVFYLSTSGRLEGEINRKIGIPEIAIEEASKIIVRIHPGVFSQVVQGLESMLRMPFGCFEQTSSVTYPNVLILDYMQQTKQIKPEIAMKAEGFINLGYQRLLTFEVPGGGFEWFGNAPANKLLTAYGLMEFKDMSRVYDIDPSVITRTAKWLLDQQEPEGYWTPDKNYLHVDVWGKLKGKDVLVTSYITWALLEAEFEEEEKVKKAITYIRQHLDRLDEPYALAVCANALASYAPKEKSTKSVLEKLKESAIVEEDIAYWEPRISSITHSRGKGVRIEATALASYALIKSGEYPDLLKKSLNYLIQNKDPQGGWYSTQGTVLTLKTLLHALRGIEKEIKGTVIVKIHGEEVERFEITPKDWDVVRTVDLGDKTRNGENEVELKFEGKGSVLYEITSKFYLPWEKLPPRKVPILSIEVDYDRTQLFQNDIVKVNVKVRNNQHKTANMVIIDLGIPPGFQVLTPDLDKLVNDKVIERYNLTGRQVIVYLEEIKGNERVEFSYGIRAKFPLKAKTGVCKVYEYYNPKQGMSLAPSEIIVEHK